MLFGVWHFIVIGNCRWSLHNIYKRMKRGSIDDDIM